MSDRQVLLLTLEGVRRAELLAQQVHSVDKLIELGFAIHQDLFACDDLWNLHRKDEIFRRLLVPACNGRGAGVP